ncbi:ribonuclease domain-containing protein, partial [Waddlia chondrophila]
TEAKLLGAAGKGLNRAARWLNFAEKEVKAACKMEGTAAKISRDIAPKIERSVKDVVSNGIPSKVRDTLDHINKTGNIPSGYKGGRIFKNDGRGGGQQLPQKDVFGNRITYKEYDVAPYQKGVNRGAERLVRGNDGKSYYTNDHYKTFTPME